MGTLWGVEEELLTAAWIHPGNVDLEILVLCVLKIV
jgi:hypothetical protein